MTPDELVANIRQGQVIQKEDFSGTDLSGLELAGGIFEEVNFTQANLAGAQLSESIFNTSRRRHTR